MPIRNFPFLSPWADAPPNPWLPVKITNPDNKFIHYTYGLVDTGSNDCVIPEFIAKSLGHKIDRGDEIYVHTGGGETECYLHTVEIEVFDEKTNCGLYTISSGLIGVLPGLRYVLLGVNNFLSNFQLCIDYPKQTFSLIYPNKDKEAP